jgi:hypothetical protein
VVKPFRRYKAMRNNSMPDLTDLLPHSPAHAERQFIYNKWFIKPDQRLKRKPLAIRSSLQSHPSTCRPTQPPPTSTSPSTPSTTSPTARRSRPARRKQPCATSAPTARTSKCWPPSASTSRPTQSQTAALETRTRSGRLHHRLPAQGRPADPRPPRQTIQVPPLTTNIISQ